MPKRALHSVAIAELGGRAENRTAEPPPAPNLTLRIRIHIQPHCHGAPIQGSNPLFRKLGRLPLSGSQTFSRPTCAVLAERTLQPKQYGMGWLQYQNDTTCHAARHNLIEMPFRGQFVSGTMVTEDCGTLENKVHRGIRTHPIVTSGSGR
jgi:hypothetical protein